MLTFSGFIAKEVTRVSTLCFYLFDQAELEKSAELAYTFCFSPGDEE
jgi:hypothetical protein